MPVINVDFLTATHRLSCRVEIATVGLLGLLNDVNNSTVEVRDLYLSRLDQPAKILASFETGTLHKANLGLALLLRREDAGPPAMARGGFGRLVSYPVLIASPAFEVRGTVDYPGKLDGTALLVSGSAKFMAVFQATALATHYPDKPFTAEAMLVNRAVVAVLAAVPRGKA